MNPLRLRAWDKIDRVYRELTAIDFVNHEVSLMPTYEDLEGGTQITRGFRDMELERSTGLFDKNRREIYEGDILEYYSGLVPKGENPRVKQLVKWSVYQWIGISNIKRCEIIGNIHENPEMLSP